MKASSLIKSLQKLPADVEVAFYIYDNEWSQGAYVPVERVQLKEETDVFDHHEPTAQKNTFRSVYRKEPWIVLFPKDDEEAKYGAVGQLYGRSTSER